MNKISKIAIILLFIFCGYMLTETINSPSQNAVRAICTGLSVDYSENEVEVSSQIVIPEAGGQYTQKLSIVEAKGKSIEEALHKMEFYVGKKIRLGHCGFIVISKDFCDRDITSNFDYFLRGNNLGNNTLLLFTEGKAKDILKSASNVNSNEIDNLQINSKFNSKYLFSRSANLLGFFNDYHSPHSTSHMPCLIVKKENKEKSSSGSEEQSSSSQTSTDSLRNDGSVAIFYQGRFAKLLNQSECEDFNWLDTNLKNARIRLENINAENLKNAQVTFTISQKKLKYRYSFIQNQPTIEIDFSLGLKPEAISSASLPPAYMDVVDSTVTSAINQKIADSIENLLDIEREYGFDVFNFYREFNIYCHAEWKKYIASLGDSHYLKNVRIITHATCFDDF